MTSLPVKGMASTFSKNAETTDSAASATALSSGHKVPNGALNRDTVTGRDFEPMTPFAKKLGYKVGIVVSCGPNHATPAGFYAHADSRNEYPKIATQMAQSDVDYISGSYVLGMDKNKDNIKELATDNGFTIVSNRAGFDALKPGSGKVWVYSDYPKAKDAKHAISLADSTAKAISLLNNPNGFFIMIEGSQIDWANHNNDGAGMVEETIEFDKAIAEAVKFYEQHPDETLIVITADHETGGLSLDEKKVAARGMSSILQGQKSSRTGKAMSDMFKSFEKDRLVFEEALPAMVDFFGVTTLTEKELLAVRKAYIGGGEERGDFSYSDNKKLALTWVQLVSARAGLNYSSLGHTSSRVPVYAIGANSDRFAGLIDNALIAQYIRELLKETKTVSQTDFDCQREFQNAYAQALAH